MTATRYAICVEGVVLHGEFKSFLRAVTAVFALYFIFNMEYSAGIVATMEFIQRYCFVKFCSAHFMYGFGLVNELYSIT